MVDTSADVRLDNRHFVSSTLMDRLVNRLKKDHGMPQQKAEQVIDQTLSFLRLCGIERDVRYCPSPTVDLGWHTFLLYTREYEKFCTLVAGRLIHHEPNDSPGEQPPGLGPSLAVKAMKLIGLHVIDELWEPRNDTPECDATECGAKCAG